MRKTEHEQLNELTDFLKLEIGITPSEMIGYVAIFKRDTLSTITVTPTNRSCPIESYTTIKSGTKVKIIRPCCSIDLKFKSLNDNIIFEILNPQIVIEKIQIDLRQFFEAVK